MGVGHPDYFRQSAFSQFGAFAFNAEQGTVETTDTIKILDLDGRGSVYNLYWIVTSTATELGDAILLEIDDNIVNGIQFATELIYGWPYTEGFYFKNSYLASDALKWCGCITQVFTFAENLSLYYKAGSITARDYAIYFLWGRNKEG